MMTSIANQNGDRISSVNGGRSNKLEEDLNCNKIAASAPATQSASSPLSPAGRVFRSELPPLIKDGDIAQFPSLGHYIMRRLESDNADSTILVSRDLH